MNLKDSLNDKQRQIKSDLKKEETRNESSDSDSSAYPKFDARIPYLALYRDDSGELQYSFSPQNLPIEYVKKSEHSGWDKHLQPEEMERYWMEQTSVNRVSQMVEDHTGQDFMELLRENPEGALEAITTAAKRKSPQSRDTNTGSCFICGEELHSIEDGGEFELINKKRICVSHTVKELKENGVLDQSGMPRNRIWE